MQVSLDTYSNISDLENEKSSIDKLIEKFLAIINQLNGVERADNRQISYTRLIQKVLDGYSPGKGPSIVDVHVALRYLVNGEFLFEVENAPVVCYTAFQPKRNSVYSTSEEDNEMVKHATFLNKEKKGDSGDYSRKGVRNNSSNHKTGVQAAK